jgi:hypothetical protein
MAAEAASPGSVRETARSIEPLKQHLGRLRRRPGATHRKRGAA